mmetsp:Transcript_57056/g.118393  ORF Transcript_57056/g.118393 Transcript_57056/m.118393 type:complete len:86 (+) Transcript_57056:190-447(+)
MSIQKRSTFLSVYLDIAAWQCRNACREADVNLFCCSPPTWDAAFKRQRISLQACAGLRVGTASKARMCCLHIAQCLCRPCAAFHD